MRCTIVFTVLLSVLSVAPLYGDDGLFSEVAMESVFQTSTSRTPTASKDLSGSVDRVTSVASLLQVLSAAGLEAEESNGRATTKLSHAGWEFPVSIAIRIDQDRLDCRLMLTEIGDGQQASTETLLKLLALGDEQGTAFSYGTVSKTLQVRAALSNRSITASQLKADLVRMAGFAEEHAELWSSLTISGTSKAPSAPAATAKSPAPQDSSGNAVANQENQPQSADTLAPLLGRWSASLASNEAFAIQITAEAQFQLVHLKAGKSTVSKGKITRSGQQLKLVGEGDLTLNCDVTQSSAKAFALAIKGADGKVAMTLNFKKAG